MQPARSLKNLVFVAGGGGTFAGAGFDGARSLSKTKLDRLRSSGVAASRGGRGGNAANGRSIADLVRDSGDLALLESALSKCSSLADAAGDERQRLTVFAPTNRAFEETFTDLNQSPQQFLARDDVCEILSLHVSGEAINPRSIRDGERIPTLFKDDRGRPVEIEAVVSGRGAQEMLEFKARSKPRSTARWLCFLPDCALSRCILAEFE